MYTAMRTGRLPGSSTSHSTLMMRSRSRTLLATVRQSRACTVSPRPRVMKPTIGSPGSGLQHLANRTRRSSTPRIRTPCSVFARAAAEGRGFSGASSVAFGASLLRSWCTELLP